MRQPPRPCGKRTSFGKSVYAVKGGEIQLPTLDDAGGNTGRLGDVAHGPVAPFLIATCKDQLVGIEAGQVFCGLETESHIGTCSQRTVWRGGGPVTMTTRPVRAAVESGRDWNCLIMKESDMLLATG